MLIEPAPVRPSGRTRLPVALAVIGMLIGVGAFAIAATVGPSNAPAPVAGAAANAALDQAAVDASPGDGAWQAPAGAVGPNGGFLGGRGTPMMGAGGPGLGFGRGGMLGGAISITKIDGSKLSLATADGWTRTIDATGATITRAGKTIAVTDLAVGDQIAFREARQSNGSFTITAITVVVPQVAGTVKAVSGSTVTITLRDGSTQDITVTGSTTYTLGGQAADKSAVTVGAQVSAQGTKASNGTFTALAINVQPNRLVGTVTATTSSTITVKTSDGTSVTVNVDAKTTYRVNGVTSPTIKNVATGAVVVATGRRSSNTTFQATAVWSLPAGTPGIVPGFRGGMGGRGGGSWGSGMHPGGGFGPAATPAPSAGAGA